MTEARLARIDIGLCHPSLALRVDTVGHWHAHDFAITPDEPGPTRMFDSCVATPARYLLEMFRRIDAATVESRGALLLFNPLLLLRRDETLVILTVLRQIESLSVDRPAIHVLCDANDVPLAYLLPRALIDDGRFLLLLSCSNATLDASALAALYDCPTRTTSLDISVSLAISNGFHTASALRPGEVCCRHAAMLLSMRRDAAGADDHRSRRECRNALPLFAFVSHHAGDVLFATLAARTTPALFHGLVIHQDYAAICDHAGLPLPTLQFSGPVAHRGGYTRNDPEHFLDVFPALPNDRFYVYARTSRDYNNSSHHLIDHYAFLLGASLASAADLNGGRPATLAAGGPTPPATEVDGRRRILLHFDAGWPLKIYPPEWQRELAGLLLQRGHSLTMLDTTATIHGCQNVRFDSLPHFEALLQQHDLLIGMDSFPAHYASLVGQTPTVCLFSSTHPAHSRTTRSARYQWLCEELGCAPCRSFQRCPRFGGNICRNFSRPDKVFRVVEQILAATACSVRTHSPTSGAVGLAQSDCSAEFKSLPSAQLPPHLRAQNGRPLVLRGERLNYRVAHRRYRFMRALRSPLTAYRLLAEYVAAVRTQGWWRANSLSWEYVMRLLGRGQRPDDR
ncbi:glycosyltransferase family 9 protein [Accumulibacter sp.]|uniref:glycosyltransferase family 9 protein n=1 Tax=Accumulibacter sp. TaxID=2053492 RepID=UPI0026206C54|nr:glycosyltransferase family 9 protein [Accumulibacter sp.]